jgi:hypothetical protein
LVFEKQHGFLVYFSYVKNARFYEWKSISIKNTDSFKGTGSMITAVALFKQYSEIETKTFKGGEKLIYQNEKTFNDTKLPITFLDSKWFTNLVKSDGFAVRGHFRLQPYGIEMKQKKLIWIEDFMKTGYTAPARKITSVSQ